MLGNLKQQITLTRLRCEATMQEIENERLARFARGSRPRFYNPALARAGLLLEALGCELQRRYGEEIAGERSLKDATTSEGFPA